MQSCQIKVSLFQTTLLPALSYGWLHYPAEKLPIALSIIQKWNKVFFSLTNVFCRVSSIFHIVNRQKQKRLHRSWKILLQRTILKTVFLLFSGHIQVEPVQFTFLSSKKITLFQFSFVYVKFDFNHSTCNLLNWTINACTGSFCFDAEICEVVQKLQHVLK